MTRKGLKSNASKVVALVLTGAMVGTGAAIALGNSATLLTPAQAAAASNKYVSDYSSKHEAIQAGYALNIKIAEEGIVLLKNENNTLPLLTTKGLSAKGVTVFGYNGAVPNGGSGANGGDTSAGEVGNAGTVYDTLAAVGYRVNPYVRDFYKTQITGVKNADGKYVGKTSDYQLKGAFDAAKETLEASYSTYGDAAVVVLGVGDTSAKKTVDGKEVPELLYNTQYNQAQKDLVDYVTTKFDKVIVVINKAYPVELDWIKKNNKVGAILNVNEPGTNGLVALGSVMCGDVNPSGRLADSFPVDQTKDPAYVNFPNKTLGLFTVKDENNQEVSAILDGGKNAAGFTDYEEGIYVGYRYWETRAADEEDATWYDNNVSYTFGYGLSYTNFKWEVTPQKAANSEITANDVLKFDVKVTNEGNVAGKDVVQLYFHAPYYNGEIEKAEVVLEDFAKTELLQPQQSQTLTLSVKVKDLASYDWNDANKNGHRGYELDNGDYELRIMRNAHYNSATDTAVKYTVNGTQGTGTRKGIFVDKSETGYTIENQFEYMNAYASGYSDELEDKDGNKYSTYTFKNVTEQNIGFDAKMSRSSTYTKTVGEATLKGLQVPATGPVNILLKDKTLAQFKEYAGQSYEDVTGKPWYVSDMPEYMTNEERAAAPVAKVVLSQLIGKAYDDPMWDDLLDELTLLEMQNLINYGGWNTGAIEYIGKPSTRDTDGPKGWSGSGKAGEVGNMFCAEPMIAATFNTDLIYELGKNMGDQGLWGSTDRTSGKQESYTCWYAPGMNLHRGPFDSRLAEYYSEDPVLMGKMAAAVSLGMRSKGGYITMKHFALHNDGGTVRNSWGDGADGLDGLYAWADEQTMRELYLRSYQICASEGEANDAMASFTRFGYINAGANYGLMTEIFRNEWGCTGYVVTDIAPSPFQSGYQLIRAGGNLLLTAGFGSKRVYIKVVDEETGEPLTAEQKTALEKQGYICGEITASQVAAMRNATKGILWSVANSNAMQIPPAAVVRFEDDNKVLSAQVKTNATFKLKAATLGTAYAYSTISYAVTNGNLPAGMEIDEETGEISGKPTVAGIYNVTVTASAAGYISASVDYTIVIGDDYAEIIKAVEASGATGGKSIKSVAKKSSEGLTDTYTITFTDDTTFDYTVTNGKDGANGVDGKDGKDGAAGADGSGCGGVVGATSAILAALAILGGAGLVLRKKKED